MSSLVGRRAELAEVRRALTASRLVTITGPAGIGKTRVAIRVAGDLSKRFADGACFVDLSWARPSGSVAVTVADALRRADLGFLKAHELARQMVGKHLLLVLDTCERQVETCAALAESVLAAAPELRIIATSRRSLGISGEHMVAIGPLAVPGEDGDADLRTLLSNDAVNLLAERACAVAPGFAVSRHNGAHVAALCRRLEGVPLAIEIAAVQLRSLSAAELIRKMDSGGQMLGAVRRGGVPRQRTMRAAIAWSFDLCTPRERLAWARLAVFACDFGIAAAETVCAGRGIMQGTESDVIAALVDKSIVQVRRLGGEVSYSMLGPTREYGRMWLRTLGEERLVLRRHRDWCLAVAHRGEVEWLGGRQADIFRRTEAEHASLEAALEFSFTMPGEREAGLELAATLWFYWIGCGHLGDGRYWLERGLADLAAADDQTPPAGRLRPAHGDHDPVANGAPGRSRSRAKALWASGYIAALQGDIASAEQNFAECREHALAAADEPLLASSIHGLGSAALIGGDLAKAGRLLADALDRYERLGEMGSNVIIATVEGAIAIMFQGDQDEAARICAKARGVCTARRDEWAGAYADYVLALAAWARRDPATGLAHGCACLRLSHTLQDLVGVALAIELIALLAAAGGDPTKAAVLLGAASRIWPRIGRPNLGSPHLIDAHEECVRRVEKELTEGEYAAAFGYGAKLPLDGAVACALAPSGTATPGRRSSPPTRRAGAGAATAPGSSRHRSARQNGFQAGVTAGQTGQPGGEGQAGGEGGAGWRRGHAAGIPANMGANVMPVPADHPPKGAAAPWPPLSRRECEVAALVAEGFSNREIAQRLVIAKRTVDAHLEHILAKLAFSSRAQVAAWVTERRSDSESNGDGDGGGGGDDGEPGHGAAWSPPASPPATRSAPAEIGSQPSPGGPGCGQRRAVNGSATLGTPSGHLPIAAP